MERFRFHVILLNFACPAQEGFQIGKSSLGNPLAFIGRPDYHEVK
jgi:hypothetical protein